MINTKYTKYRESEVDYIDFFKKAAALTERLLFYLYSLF